MKEGRRIRLYGATKGESSFTQVTRGMERALRATGEFAGFCPTDTEVDAEASGATDGADAPIALVTGAPSGLIRAHRQGAHRQHWLLLAPNGERLPRGFLEQWMTPSETLPEGLLTGGLLAPSAWAAGVLCAEIGRARPRLAQVPVLVAPHGVRPEVHHSSPEAARYARELFEAGEFRGLHMTSTDTERKGTRALLRAWRTALNRGDLPRLAMLFLLAPAAQMSRVREWISDASLEGQVILLPSFVHPSEHLTANMRSCHLVCQPSRGEGFGMVPLEALACGVPVCATACTGHSEWLQAHRRGVQRIPHGDIEPMDDFPGSLAPSVSESAIADALGEAYRNWPTLQAEALEDSAELAAGWSWEAGSAEPIRSMVKMCSN